MTPAKFSGIAAGALLLYLLPCGLFLRMTPPYSRHFDPLSSSAAAVSRTVYAPLIWIIEDAPPMASTPLKSYLEFWGCTFPPKRNPRQGVHRRYLH